MHPGAVLQCGVRLGVVVLLLAWVGCVTGRASERAQSVSHNRFTSDEMALIFLADAHHEHWFNTSALAEVDLLLAELRGGGGGGNVGRSVRAGVQQPSRRTFHEVELTEPYKTLVDDDPDVVAARVNALERRRIKLMSNHTVPHFHCRGSHCRAEFLPLAVVCRGFPSEVVSEAASGKFGAPQRRRFSMLSVFSDDEAELLRPRVVHDIARLSPSDEMLWSENWLCAVLRPPQLPGHFRFEDLRVECQHHSSSSATSSFSQSHGPGEAEEAPSRKSRSRSVSKSNAEHPHAKKALRHVSHALSTPFKSDFEHDTDSISDVFDVADEVFVQVTSRHNQGEKEEAQEVHVELVRRCRLQFEIVNYGPLPEKLALIVLVSLVIVFLIVMLYCVNTAQYREQVGRAKIGARFNSWAGDRGLSYSRHDTAASERISSILSGTYAKGSQTDSGRDMRPATASRARRKTEVPAVDSSFELPTELAAFADQGATVFSQNLGASGGFNVYDNPSGLSLGELRARARPRAVVQVPLTSDKIAAAVDSWRELSRPARNASGRENTRGQLSLANGQNVGSSAVTVNEGTTYPIDGL